MFETKPQDPKTQNFPNISSLNVDSLNLLNCSSLNPALSIFPNSNEGRPINNSMNLGNNRSVFNRNRLFMN